MNDSACNIILLIILIVFIIYFIKLYYKSHSGSIIGVNDNDIFKVKFM